MIRIRVAVAAALLGSASVAGCGPGEPPLPDAPQFDPVIAWNRLGTQVSFGPRVAGLPPHDQQLTWMADQLGFLADTLVLQPFTDRAGGDKPLRFTNVLARWRPELKDRVLLVTHWDTRLYADRAALPEDRTHPVPGANAGASGTAVLMELARLLHGTPPPVGVDLLFTDGSDVGIDPAVVGLGMRHYVATLGGAARPRWAVYVDRVGDVDLRIPREPSSSPAVADRLWALAHRMGRDSVWVNRPGPAVPGEHAVLAAAGIPTAVVVDPEFGPGDRFARTSSDHIANTSRHSLGQVGDVLTMAVYAEAPAP